MDDYLYFLPGYTGFCPEIKDHFGKTYGHLTRRILNEKPYLKDRLAPVFYKHRRSKIDKKGYGKYCDQEKHEYDRSKAKQRMKDLYPGRAKHGAVYEDGDYTCRDGKAKHHSVYDDGDTNRDVRTIYHAFHKNDNSNGDGRGKYHSVLYDDGDTSRDGKARYRAVYGDGDNRDSMCRTDYEKACHNREKRDTLHDASDNYKNSDRVEHDCACPKYFIFQGYAGCLPENWTNRYKQDTHYNNFPFASPVSAGQFNLKKNSKHVNEHPEVTRQKKGPRMARVPRVKPHRQGGVIPKYTGHIPGMLFMFGESYGPASDKLLQRHRDNLAHYKRKS